MKSLSILAVVLALGLSLVTVDAEAAKRLGGGKSTGMQRQNTTEKAPAATPGQPANNATSAAAAPASAAAATAAAAPKRSWMGPLAGIAAGLGLAALASHFGFGEQMANMLMIGLLVFAVIAVVGFIMRKRAMANQGGAKAGGMQYAAAGAGASSYGNTPANKPYEVSMPASSGGSVIGANLAPATASNAIPADFDAAGFARNAKVQFIRLQAANNVGNLADIRDFTTPEMFAELKMDITERGGAQSKTDVVSVNADIISVTQDADQHVVSVRFTGTIRDEAEPQAESFDETWHLVKPVTGAAGWLLSGIQQNA